MPSKLLPTLLCILLPLAWFGACCQAVQGQIDFQTEVLPILSDRCYLCHGPDAAHREADLRLDLAEEAAGVIEAGDRENSELLRRVMSTDPDEMMPPPASKLSLNAAEKEILGKWIDEGAVYDGHWAFQPLVRPPVPGKDANPIDAFIRHDLRAADLDLSPLSDRFTLARRLSFDLTGLPPEPSLLSRFVSHESQLSVTQFIDRLLASPAFGERMASYWLDVARYADTHGYQNDRYRPMWPWRDWVVEAFNQNLPYDQFVLWQVAGDLIPNRTQSQILATGFNRNHRQTNEGGSVEEEFRAEYVADRVNTFGAAFLGLTLECSRCHDHKYDPISQEDYYSLAAFFNSIDESGLYSHFTESTPTPALTLADERQAQRISELDREVREAGRQLANVESVDVGFEQWRASLSDVRPGISSTTTRDQLALATLVAESLQQALDGHYPLDGTDENRVADSSEHKRHGRAKEDPSVESGRIGQALSFSGDNGITVPAGGDFLRHQPFSISLWLYPAEEYERAVVYHRSRAWTDSASRGYELLIEDGRLSAAWVHFWPGNAMRVRSVDALPIKTWSHVTVCYDGSSQAAGVQIFVNGQPTEVEVIRDKLTRSIAADPMELALAQRFRDKGLRQGKVDELRVFDRQLTALEAKVLFLKDAAPENLDEVLYNVSDKLLREFYLSQSEAYLQQLDALQTARKSLNDLVDAQPEIMVMREMANPRPSYVLQRGAYDAPGNQVERDVPQQIFPATWTDPQPDRLDLAHWLIDRRNPLVARVAVNRFWQQLFGQGLVSTPEDFGRQGMPPTHPELLDWLATEFVESGWDVKALLRLIVSSRTYQQSSDVNPRLLEVDPENRLMARGPARRLTAEMLRDAALFSAGLLSAEIGGPPVKPYQPAGLWKEKSGVVYQRDKGAGSHRRSLYTYWKRTSPPPSMMTFDASTREVCSVQRQSTATPLQVLVLLNDPQFVEAARGIAHAAQSRFENVEGRIQAVFRSLVSRPPSTDELEVLVRMYSEQLEQFKQQPGLADELLAVGEVVFDLQSQDKNELAALAVMAGGLLAYDEAMMIR